MTARRVAVVTGGRADFGLLSRVIAGLMARADVECQVVVTGSHLSVEHGATASEIESSGVPIAWRVDLGLHGDSALETGQAMGRAVIGFADAYHALQPDLIVVLGDRYEILAAVSAAAVASIPVAHLHGGELSEGAVDDALRHAITKLSHLHFVAAEPYRQRVVQLGEAPERVVVVGGMGVDLARHTPLWSRERLALDTGFVFGARNLIVTFHPVTLDQQQGDAELEALLQALGSMTETHLLFTLPNADVGNAGIRARILAFVTAHASAWAFPSLGFVRYLSFVAASDGVVGNSSSGLIEAPALGVGTLNVGGRQAGRLRASSVIDCVAERGSIEAALAQMFSPEFRASLSEIRNPYGEGGGADEVVRVLCMTESAGLLVKHFHDIQCPALAQEQNA